MMEYEWYSQIIRPTWAPPAWLFGPVWSVLYVLIAISFGYIFYLYFKKRLPGFVALPFFLNLVFNALFTPLQFGLRNNYLAAFDILLVLVTIAWSFAAVMKFSSRNVSTTIQSFPKIRWVVALNIPYLLWVSFATVLQLTVVWLNR